MRNSIPTVAQWTQGEVVRFAGEAADKMRAAGCTVLVEGREQTLNHLRTPYRFELTLSDPTIIGVRRAAQRMMGEAKKALKGVAEPTPEAIRAELEKALHKYDALLKSRAHLITEVGDLQRQNGELKALLNQYLSSRINEDLHVPPTQVIRLDGLRKK